MYTVKETVLKNEKINRLVKVVAKDYAEATETLTQWLKEAAVMSSAMTDKRVLEIIEHKDGQDFVRDRTVINSTVPQP